MRFSLGRSRLGRIESTDKIRRRLGVEEVAKKLCENRLKWFGPAFLFL